jgi:hypothetical protein
MSPEALDALSRILQAQRAEIRVALFARITRVNNTPNTPTVNCRAVIAESVESLEGARDFEELPELMEVPVLYPQGAAGFYITFPLEVGGIVHVSIGAQDFSDWFVSGQDGRAHDGRTHALNNAVAFPCGFSTGRGPLVTVGAMVIAGTEVRLGLNTAAFHVAIAERVNAAIDAVKNSYLGHTHATPSGASGPPVNVPPLALPSPAPTDVGSTVVKLSS